uniref:RNA polymerase subunit H/Rpb5 C-terminal domain-containing protein n=1 Tax=viral metagenome TaxID=1070528 RepID=A0A6C0D7Q1_9ZZZZ
MEEHVIDTLFRSRKTLLKILEEKGYDITPYEKLSPWEIEAMIVNEKKNNLKMELVHKENESKCVVMYRLNRVKQSLGKLVSSLNDQESDDYIPNLENTMVYIIVLEPVNNVDVFHNAALNALSNKINLSFFQADSLVNDPRQHILVPKHELVKKEDISALKKFLNIQSVANLPFIRFHQDIQVRLLGTVPGDVIKITRPSPSSGEETVYRVCVP